MAISGEGTAASPYIVETWEEFISVANDTAVYIQCANDCIWDFNTITPEGIQDIDISFKSWDGNNVQIKNMAFVNPLSSVKHYGLKLKGDGTYLFEMKNVNFINFYVNNSYSTPSWDAVFMASQGYLQIKNCKFSGYILNGGIFSSYLTTTSSQTNESQFINCSFNFNCKNRAYLFVSSSTRKISFNNCRFVFDGEADSNSGFTNQTQTAPLFYNCKISGKIPFRYWYFNSNTSVIDAYTINSVNITFTGNYTDTIINSDKYNNSATLPTYLKQVTTAQMVDISYLQSIGFPVIEVL